MKTIKETIKKGRFKIIGQEKKKTLYIDGEILILDGFKFGCHRRTDLLGYPEWVITDWETGCIICKNYEKEEVIIQSLFLFYSPIYFTAQQVAIQKLNIWGIKFPINKNQKHHETIY